MEIKGLWKRKGREVKYENPWIRVYEDSVIRPDGNDGIFGIVERGSGVSVLPMDDDGAVYLVKQFRYTMGMDTIEVPSGGIDGDEDPLEAAKRELSEETGIVAKEWIGLGTIHPFTSIVRSSQNLYLVRSLTFGESHTEGTEDITVSKVDFEEAVRMVMEGKIVHAPSALLIMMAWHHLNNR